MADRHTFTGVIVISSDIAELKKFKVGCRDLNDVKEILSSVWFCFLPAKFTR